MRFVEGVAFGLAFQSDGTQRWAGALFPGVFASDLDGSEAGPEEIQGMQMQQFKEDSIAWETNPLYGWCNKNKKPDGEYYNVYTDGLKIYTTIDSRMQQYAEDAVREHIGGYLQNAFFKAKKGKSYAPFSEDLRPGEVDTIFMRAMHQTDRYRAMKKGRSEREGDNGGIQ